MHLIPKLVPLHGLPSVTDMVYPQIWIPSDSHSQIMVPTVFLLRSHQCCVPQSAVSLVLRGSRLHMDKAPSLSHEYHRAARKIQWHLHVIWTLLLFYLLVVKG